MSLEMAIVRILFVVALIGASYHLRPFHLSAWYSALVGAGLGIFFVFLEVRLEKTSLKRLIGAAIGSILGVVGALMISRMLASTLIDASSASFLQVAFLLLLGYVGLVLGANKGDLLNLTAFGGIFSGERGSRTPVK